MAVGRFSATKRTGGRSYAPTPGILRQRRYFVEPVDLSQLVREIGALIQSSIPKKMTVRLALADDLSLVEVDPTQMRQLVMNL